ncbi:MAG: hypothetical protein Athens071426_678 [Parcubacteria group bacterium Athens0714_26]|nr:MAG: hypothetical protein Athens071426_678 [Parcubacteria group bacterium Athens0714_26]
MNFSILDWNIQGTRYYTSTSLAEVTPDLENSGADIFCLQEAQEVREKRPGFIEQQKLNCIFSEDKENRNVILSKFPIIASGELAFPPFKDPKDSQNSSFIKTVWSNIKYFLPPYTGLAPEKALWADIKISSEVIRIYNCHFEIVGVGPKERVNQLKLVMADAKSHRGPVIICGDFNTTIPAAGFGRKFIQLFHLESNRSLVVDEKRSPDDERYTIVKVAEEAGFYDALDITKSTWCIMPFKWEIFSLKLDWFLVRGLKMPQITLGEYISDHRSVLVKFLI